MLEPGDFKASVVAVPPIALTDQYVIDESQNDSLVRHIARGGVHLFLYGGNANLYNFDLGRYADALAMMTSVIKAPSRVIVSIGPDYGKMIDQAPLVHRAGIRDVMLLPMAFAADSHGVGDGVRRIAERLGFGVILYLKRENYVRPESLARLVSEGAVRFVKYAVERGDPSQDEYLDAIVAAVGPNLVASGMGETPIADHVGRRQLATYTSGAVCIAPAASTRLLQLLRKRRQAEIDELIKPFLAFERLRSRLGGIQVLHDAVTASGIADMGPQLPMLSNVKARFMDEVRAATADLLNAEKAAIAAVAVH